MVSDKLSITCPQCRKRTKVAKGNPASLKSNFYVGEAIKLMQSVSSDGAQRAKPAIASKPDYSSTRASTPSTGSNKSLDTISPPGGDGWNQHGCDKHQQQPLLFYCETCAVPICMNCTVLDHDKNHGHIIIDICQAAQVHREILASKLDKLDDVVNDHTVCLQELKAQMRHLDIVKDVTEQRLKEMFNQLVSRLRQRENQLQER